MISRTYVPTAKRRGLTLMELVVVMAILIALAAIIVPLMPGLLGRAERASRATNSQEVCKTVQLFSAMYSHYPTDWDSLTDGTATPLGWLDGTTSGFQDIGLGAGGGTLALTAMTAGQASSLTGAGINRVQKFLTAAPTGNNGQDVTFNPYATADRAADGIVVATGTNLVTLTPKGQFQLGLNDSATGASTGTYVVFGLGRRCSIIGITMNDPPVNYFDSASKSPDTRYSRYGVVFQVTGVAPTNSAAGASTPQIDFARAKLVRVFRFGSAGLGTGDDAIRDYWRDVVSGDGA